MLVLRDELAEAYREIRKASSSSSPVLVIASSECDSVCASAIITSLLRMDHIPYKVMPISSYADASVIQGHFQSIFMINCGATVDLEKLFQSRDQMLVYVLDSHRPYHLSNIRPDNASIICLDSNTEYATYPSDHDLSSDDDDDLVQRRHRVDRRSKVADHYGGTYHDISAAVLAYDLAQQLSKDDNDMLWSAIVGLTDQLVFERITKWTYQNEVHLLQSQVQNKNQSGDDTNKNADDEAQIQVPVDGFIAFETHDLDFTLLRHWNLFDSMAHSRKVAIKLKVWRDTGTQQLNLILAKLGIPKQESRSPYFLMRLDCKNRLRNELSKYAHEYDLGSADLYLPSFTRRYAGALIVAAADTVHAITACLESSSERDENFWSSLDVLRFVNASLIRKEIDLAISLHEKIAIRAHALLSKKAITSTGKYRLCILDASEAQSAFCRPLALTQLGLLLINAYETVLHEQSGVQRKRSRNGGRRVKILPFVLCSYIQERHSYLVVGLPRSEETSELQRNPFSVAFTDAVFLTKARARQDGFEASIVEIARDDLKPFLETLVHQLETR